MQLAHTLPLFLLSAALTAQGPPRVVSLEPLHLDVEVDAAKITEIVVTFDQAMNTEGWSFCGGGPTFPKGKRPRWKNPRTCVMEVELEPDHEYRLSLNCPAARNFRSRAGVPLAPVPWHFSTLPKKLPPVKKQRAQNREAFKALQKLLETKEPDDDHRGLDWKKIYKEHGKEVQRSRTTRGWATAVGRMLAPTGDLHLYLRYRGTTIPTGTRAIDSLYREKLLSKYIDHLHGVTGGVLAGRTQDGIGYLMIGNWSNNLDLDAVEEELAKLADTQALIVDVRPNSGGSEMAARRIAAWFVEGEKVYAKNTYRTGKGKNGFGPVLDRSIRGNSGSKRYAGRVAVLMSRYVMSSNEAFVLMMHQGQDCKLIGQHTFGSSGNPKPHELPNGVEIVIPSWKALRPDGTCFEAEGVQPDIRVEVGDGDLESRDPILERALEYLER